MGRSYRSRPAKLSKKLRLIRKRLGLTQRELIETLAIKDEPLYPSSISEYENGKREPPLLVLLAYAKLAGVTMETLADDKMKLTWNRDQPAKSASSSVS
ncbi:MAG TPA: helix-turn-helix transcriptional regulator [Pyrinomonadaceae bacterium]|nr:helix-turn-helix transcriptional regulator [Pyrinomonadaceae bacterium]